MNTKLEEVKRVVIEAVPSIYTQICPKCDEPVAYTETGYHDCGGFLRNRGTVSVRPIALADVLRALAGTGQYGISCSPLPNTQFVDMLAIVEENLVQADWDLALSLDEQEQPVIDFLHRILVTS